jgi:hypothetical protein
VKFDAFTLFLMGCALQILFIIISIGLARPITRIVEILSGSSFEHWIQRLCIGAASAVVFLAIIGVIIAFSPWQYRNYIGIVAISIPMMMSIYLLLHLSYIKKIIYDTRLSERIFFGGYILLCFLSLAIALLPIKLPAQLVDGPYVNKEHVLGVKIQFLTGNLPTDNSLPHVVSEYILRDISFAKEHPIMPGQEVTNRPILQALAILPFRAALLMPKQWPGPFPKFNYVGTDWPNFRLLMQDDRAYLISLSLGIAFNGLLLLALGMFAVRHENFSRFIALSSVFLFVTSPYFLFQTIFTWPKGLAAFFILLAFTILEKKKAIFFVGLILGLAYLSHPYAIVFFFAYILYLGYSFIRFWKISRDYRSVILFVLGFSIVIMPWIYWSKFFLELPSDLISQNLIIPGQTWIDFLWVRAVNILNLISPTNLLVYPFDINRITIGSTVTLAGALGISIYLTVISNLNKFSYFIKPEILILWLLPVFLLVCIFSNQAVPALHGLQGPFALLLLFGVNKILKRSGEVVARSIISLQLIINISFLALYLRYLI